MTETFNKEPESKAQLKMRKKLSPQPCNCASLFFAVLVPASTVASGTLPCVVLFPEPKTSLGGGRTLDAP